MKLRSLVTVALGMGLAVAVPAVAHAYTSYTIGSVNFRSGPGVGYSSYGTLPAGTQVDVRYCQAGWCQASAFLGNGWIASSYLGGAQGVYPRPYPYPTYRTYAYPTYRAYPYYRPYPYYGGYGDPFYRPYPYYGYPHSGFGFYFGSR